jgi:predicted ABC-type ATPase
MRVKQGGHNIPEEDIRRRYQRSLDNLVSAVPLCDLLEVFDNSFTFTKVLEVEQGQLKIISEEIPSWSLSFIQKFQKLEYSNFF